MKSLLTLVFATFLLSFNALAQSAPPSSVKTVVVIASAKEAEVGQQVKITVTAKDAAGNLINEKPSTYFAGPFDIAAADDDGNVKLFGTGEVTVGAIVGGMPGFSTFMVKAPTVKTIEIAPVKTPLVTGGNVQLDAVTRIFNGDPRTGVPVSWTSDNAQVVTIDEAGVVTGVAP
ncbi:MAG TPA: Ig-like domain-containing protein, partial [Pyrinomonadaceae bacterium]|nr:Ig-like domain-containing protein [Pyrinomonadaceae bacterium]